MTVLLPSFFYKDTSDKSSLETSQVCVVMEGDWSAATAGRKTVKGNVKVKNCPNLTFVFLNHT